MNRVVYISCLLLCMSLMTNGQDCPDGLGENLFVAGDFGEGTSFVILEDPMIAPGYGYNRVGPPQDGDYMITNDMNQWDQFNFKYNQLNGEKILEIIFKPDRRF